MRNLDILDIGRVSNDRQNALKWTRKSPFQPKFEHLNDDKIFLKLEISSVLCIKQ